MPGRPAPRRTCPSAAGSRPETVTARQVTPRSTRLQSGSRSTSTSAGACSALRSTTRSSRSVGEPGVLAEIEIRPATVDDLDELVSVYLSAAAHHVAVDPDGYIVPTPADAAARWRHRV